MPADDPRSPQTIKTYRAADADRRLVPPVHDDGPLIERHVEKTLGPIESVAHELVSSVVHLDTLVVRRTNRFSEPETRLVTSGMSARPMTPPPGAEQNRWAELTLSLPPDWPLAEGLRPTPGKDWPLAFLHSLARLPHQYGTWLWMFHTVPNNNPWEAFAADTGFIGAAIMPPIWSPKAFKTLTVTPDRIVHFWSVVFLYPEEMEFARDRGMPGLADRILETQVSDRVDIRRRRVV